jgi:hypothetical protein
VKRQFQKEEAAAQKKQPGKAQTKKKYKQKRQHPMGRKKGALMLTSNPCGRKKCTVVKVHLKNWTCTSQNHDRLSLTLSQ